MIMTVTIPEYVQPLIRILEQNNFEVFLVGGCVRDTLMGKTPDDWDLCTSALPEEIILCFSNYKLVTSGLKHGTVTVISEHKPVEITTYRADGSYSDSRHPDEIYFVKNLQEDLKRRDFTVNAMAYNAATGLADYFGGENDLRSGCVRCVGDANIRFGEDALRIFRAMRFSSVLNFTVEEKTAAAVHANKELLSCVSAERLCTELVKMLCGENCLYVLTEFSDVLAQVIPELEPMFGFAQNHPRHFADVWMHTVYSVANSAPNKYVRLAMLFHDIAKPACHSRDEKGIDHFYRHPEKSAEIAQDVFKRLKFDNRTKETVCLLVKYHDVRIQPEEKQVRRMLSKIGEENFFLWLDVQAADSSAQASEFLPEETEKRKKIRECALKVLEESRCFSLKDLAVSGSDLIHSGVPQGKKIGYVLNVLLNKVIDGELPNEKEVLSKYALKLLNSCSSEQKKL